MAVLLKVKLLTCKVECLEIWRLLFSLRLEVKALEKGVVPVFLAGPCTPAPTAPDPGLPGAPVFLLNRLLKKLASTPSLAAPAAAEKWNLKFL